MSPVQDTLREWEERGSYFNNSLKLLSMFTVMYFCVYTNKVNIKTWRQTGKQKSVVCSYEVLDHHLLCIVSGFLRVIRHFLCIYYVQDTILNTLFLNLYKISLFPTFVDDEKGSSKRLRNLHKPHNLFNPVSLPPKPRKFPHGVLNLFRTHHLHRCLPLLLAFEN